MAAPKGGTTYAATADSDAQRIRTRVLPKLAGDADTLLALLVDLEEVGRIYKDLVGDVTALAIAALPPLKRDEAYYVDGLGHFTPTPGNSTKKYDNPRLISVIAEHLPTVVNEHGEDATAGMLDLLVSIVGAGTQGFNGWRMTPLRDMGIDPAKYITEQTQGKPSLRKKLLDNPTTVKETK